MNVKIVMGIRVKVYDEDIKGFILESIAKGLCDIWGSKLRYFTVTEEE